MNDTRNGKRDKKQHIQVFIRVRPINNSERAGKSVIVVDTPSNKEVVVRERPHDKFTKKFTFDRVFGSHSKQIEVYNAVVSPLLEEVLCGYNCTVFAYGQTGTGKTFTMEGHDNDPLIHWQKDTNAGIIPRALSHLFDELRILEVQEYSVRVSFLELYNEEIFDLLSSSDDAAKIRIYEDSVKKGAIIVHGLEEIMIHSKAEVFKILQKGSEKRQTAPTLMNANSSRSHTIFSITVHIKENSINGEEYLKTGKLNLVDLAGSENVARSGSVDRRAREAGNINQSLLTLGRVITALVEKSPHVPYRESKLTRLLQESLGGRTRTSIIATVSPASINLEETLSTLDYAHRAKNITNKPEINQKFSKKALLQEYTEEIEKLRKNLLATRERNGVYLAPENYDGMQSLMEFQGKEIEEKMNHIKALEESMMYKEEIFNKLQSQNTEQANELLNIKNELETTTRAVMSTTTRLAISEQEMEEQKHLVEKHASTENVLLSQVKTVLEVADTATSDVHKLHDKVFRKIQIGQRNSYLGQQVKNNVKERLRNIEVDVTTHTEDLMQFFSTVRNHIGSHNLLLNEYIDKSIQDISNQLVNSKKSQTEKLTNDVNDSYLRYEQWLENEIENVRSTTEKECNILNNVSVNLAPKIQQLIENKIAENLRAFNDSISQNTDELIESSEKIIAPISKRMVEECVSLNNNIQAVKESIASIQQSENSSMEKRAHFAKMMGDLQRCFNELQEEETEKYSSICNTLSNIDETCNVINNDVLNTCKINVEQENQLQEKLRSDLQTIKQVVAEETEKSWILADDAVAQGKRTINEFQTDLAKNCDTLTNYKNCVERNIRELQQKMKVDRSSILSSINDVYMIVYNASNEHARCLNGCKAAFTSVSMEIIGKLDNESLDAENTKSKLLAQLQVIRDRVDKFFVDDLFRDVPTGSTPARKNFQYNKKLIKTSPHDRILKRFRETLKDIEDIENEPILENSITPIKESLHAS